MDETNPLRSGRRLSRSPEPSTLIIFGGSGDLTRRKLIPALYRLSQQRLLPAGFTVVGISRSPMNNEQYRAMLRTWIDKSAEDSSSDSATWESFAEGIFYIAADYRDPAAYQKLTSFMSENEPARRTGGNRLFYLATAPSDYAAIVRNLGAANLSTENENGSGWVRIIIEKPFGQDLKSARELNKEVSSVFREQQVYRIDHYLGKETVQNILVFRFANEIFEPIWNRDYIDNIQITAAENQGIGSRAAYYEEAGALRDMVQSHILQLLALVTMEPPPNFSAEAVRSEKAKILNSVRPFSSEEVRRFSVRGQYSCGPIGTKEVPGYLEEQGVASGSRTETYVAIRFLIDNWRWADVPFYIRTGKNLPKRVTEIAVTFQRTPHFLFRQAPADKVESNTLAFRIQPDEGITLKFIAKLPGQSMEMNPVNMDFRYGSTFGLHLAEAYERLLLDCMLGDPTLFDRIDSVEASWELMEPFLKTWSADQDSLIPQYASGTWGPPEADELLARENRSWRLL
jgi:glucose-6-phosphate 1-dehydrogenase